MLPRTLRPKHTTLAVATPASAPRNPAAFFEGIQYLESLGYRVKTGNTQFPKEGYLSASDADRAGELNGFITDPEVDAIFCTRGGYGTLRILPMLDFAAARDNPKLLVGYSDITALHLAFLNKAGWRGISGPMVAVEWSELHPDCEKQFWQLAGSTPAGLHQNVTGRPLTPLKNGKASGILIGGNLSVLMRLIGTPYLPDLKGAILFLEDVNEPAYKIDGMLAHLKLAGIWDQLGGLILGAFTSSTHPNTSDPEILSVFEEYCTKVSFPVASRLSYGHIPVKNSMPIGVQASLDVSANTAALHILEPLTR